MIGFDEIFSSAAPTNEIAPWFHCEKAYPCQNQIVSNKL